MNVAKAYSPFQFIYPSLCIVMIVSICSCKNNSIDLHPVTYADFEQFINETGYITDAEQYGWSIVQLDVYNFTKVEDATWQKPKGEDSVSSKQLPVTQVSYNDAIAYCKWANKRLPSYDEYWELVKHDKRTIVSENQQPITEVEKVNVVGNVWDITELQPDQSVRLAGGSLFCSEKTCNGTIKERKLFVDRETGNLHIGFSVMDY